MTMKPIDNLSRAERERECRNSRPNLAVRIAEYQPRAIVSILRRIRRDVEIAAAQSGSKAYLYNVPFPGNGWQTCFRNEMKSIIPRLLEVI
jgi:hypothetical protein